MLDIVCYIKKYKESLEENVQILDYNMHKKKWISMFSSVIQIFAGTM